MITPPAARSQLVNRGELVRYPAAAGNGGTSFIEAPGPVITGYTEGLSGAKLRGMGNFRGFTAQFGAITSAGDNDTFNYRIYGVRRVFEATRAILGEDLVYVGGGVATLGTGAFIGGAVAATTGRMADTLTWTASGDATTPRGPMTAMETAVGSGGSRVFNPANNDVPAELIVPDFWWPELAIFFDSDTGSPLGMFALISFF